MAYDPRQKSYVPVTVIPKMAENSDAKSCFIQQRFSLKLQSFLVDYSMKVTSEHGIYK